MVDHVEPRPRYNVAQADSPGDLAELVTEHMAQGWRPTGGVSVVAHSEPSMLLYVQAMVRS